MTPVAPFFVCVLILPAIASGETGGSARGDETSKENESEFAESRALLALQFFRQARVHEVFLRACKRTETRLWWRVFGGEHRMAFLPVSEYGTSDGAILDVSCDEGRKLLEKVLSERDRRPDGLPALLLAASNNVVLDHIRRFYNLDGKFLGAGLVQVKASNPEYPSVFRVVLPEERVLTDPVGAVIAGRMISHLRESLDITLSFRRGNISDILAGKADLIADGILLDDKTADKVAVLSQQIWRLRTLVVMKTPGVLWGSDALLKPFSSGTWQAVAGTILATALTLRIAAFWESRDVRSSPEAKEDDNWSASLVTAMGMICAQGFSSAAAWSAARVTLVTFEVFSLFVGLFYSSAMVTFLLTLPESQITTAADLENWPLTIGVDPTYYNIPDLLKSHDPTVRTVIGLKGEYMSLWDALQVAVEEPVAFLSEEHLTLSAAGAALEVSNICRLDAVILQPDQPLFLVGSKAIISPWLQERFRRAMVHIAEIGIITGDARRAVAPPLICLQSDVTDTEPIAARTVWPAVAILGVGQLLAVAILFLEHCVKTWPPIRSLHSKAA